MVTIQVFNLAVKLRQLWTDENRSTKTDAFYTHTTFYYYVQVKVHDLVDPRTTKLLQSSYIQPTQFTLSTAQYSAQWDASVYHSTWCHARQEH